MSAVATQRRLLTVEEVARATSGGFVVRGHGVAELTGVSIDSRTLRPGELFVAIVGPRLDGHDFVAEAVARGAAAILVQREISLPPGVDVLRVGDTTAALGRLASHVRQASGLPVVCVTGSTGKTTTKEMAAALLAVLGPVLKSEGNLNNQYGLPLTLFRLSPEHRAAVLELGMSAPGELRALASVARPDLAVITNVAPVHLEFFSSVDAIAQAKAEILEGLGPGGVAVLNRDDPRVRRIGEAFPGKAIWFGWDRRNEVSAEAWRGTLFGMRFVLRLGGRPYDAALPLAGRHFVANFMAAAAAAHRLGVAPEAILEAAAQLEPAPHRGRVLRLGGGVTLLDDSYNANPAAVEAAVAALALSPRGRRIAFLGDMLELGPDGPELHRATGEKVAPLLDAIAAVGPLAAHLLEGAERAGSSSSAFLRYPDSSAAAEEAPQIVRPGDAVLVKGSRGVRMERIVDALVSHFGPGEGLG